MLPRTPVKFHYIFNLRDLSRVYEGLTRSTVDKFTTKNSIIRLWRNECLRVFCDRLINEEDRIVVGEKLIGGITKAAFDDSYESVMANPIIFGDFMTANPTDETHIDPRLY
jgi:dynein heavy chain